MPYPASYFNTPNQPAYKPGSQMWGGFGPPQGMPGYSPTQMSGFLNAGGTPTFSNEWTAHMLRPRDIKPRIQPQFNGVTPQQSMMARNGFRASLGMGPVQPRQQPMSPMQQPGPMQQQGPNMRQLSAPSGGVTPAQAMGQQQPLPPFAASDSQYSGVAQTPEGGRQWTPQEAAQMAAMERQQRNMKLRDQNLPRWQGNVDEINRQADVMERNQLPDVNAPGYSPPDWKDHYADIPGSLWGQYRDRFNAIERNRPPAPEPAKWSHNYQAELAQADPNFDVNNPQSEINKPAYYTNPEGQVVRRQRITPMPRTDTPLTDVEANRMNAVGSSVGEWQAKVDWMKQKYPGYQGEMTPAMAQEYANERQKAALAANERSFAAQKQRDEQASYRREQKLAKRQQQFQYQNPGLFADINPNSAQFYAMMNGADLRNFNSSGGGLDPEQEAALDIKQTEALQDMYDKFIEEGNAAAAEVIRRQLMDRAARMQNTNVIDGKDPRNKPPVPPAPMTPPASPVTPAQVMQQPPGTPINPYAPFKWRGPTRPANR